MDDANDILKRGDRLDPADATELAPTDRVVGARPKPAFRIGDETEIARWLLGVLTDESGHPPAFAEGDLYSYSPEEGIWRPRSQANLTALLADCSGCSIGSGDRPRPLKMNQRTIDGAINVACRLADRPDYFSAGVRGVAFGNGFFCGESADLLPHRPEHRCRFRLPFNYDECAPAPVFERTCDSWFKGEPDAAAKRRLLLEMYGLALVGQGPRVGRALMLFGPKGTGKSTALSVCEGLMPPGTISSVPPGKFDHEYYGAELAGKRLNVVCETPGREILTSVGFKSIVQGELITRRRIKGSPFAFKPTAAHVFACNELPPAPGVDPSYWDRWSVLEFRVSFRGTKNEVRGLADQLRREHPGIVARALETLGELRARGWTLTEPTSSSALMQRWRREGDSVAAFVEESTERVPSESPASHWSTVQPLFERYVSFCRSSGFSPVNVTNFGKRLRSIGVSYERSNGSRYALRFRGA